MANEHEIKSDKILVKEIFSTLWFRIPEYQRPYIWSRDQIDDLLDDLTYAHEEKPDQEYFLGSFVFQAKKAGSVLGQEYDENDLLDGQQRMTTLMLIFACVRDLCEDSDVKEICLSSIFQKGNKIHKVPERTRIMFSIRQSVQDFVDEFVKAEGGTNRIADLEQKAKTKDDPSVRNMASAIIDIRKYLTNAEVKLDLEGFVTFLCNNVLLIYVSTEKLDDAFRLFTILNNRGVPLRNSDILKSENLGKLTTEVEKARYAKMWEEAEGEMGDDFDRFLNHLRTILVKEKARLSLLEEFEQKIYHPKEKEKATGLQKQPLLKKGKPTFELIERYLAQYETLMGGGNFGDTGGSYNFDNLINVMLKGLPSTDWVPPLLAYFNRFKFEQISSFLKALDNKFSADWIAQYTPTKRIDNMNEVIRVVEKAKSVQEVLGDECFKIDVDALNRAVSSAVYGRRFTRYLLLKLDYLFGDSMQRMSVDFLSVEHVLPQNPADNSQWKKDFTDDMRNEWTHRLGNLVLITTKKNTSQGRLDFSEKKNRYFEKRITTCSNSLRVLKNAQWTQIELERNHNEVLAKLRQYYGIN
jgi:uncharacterized protein with ParB-like and HNH nuclease domain